MQGYFRENGAKHDLRKRVKGKQTEFTTIPTVPTILTTIPIVPTILTTIPMVPTLLTTVPIVATISQVICYLGDCPLLLLNPTCVFQIHPPNV